MILPAAFALFGLMWPSEAPAQQAAPEARVSGEVFADYSAPTSGGLAGFSLTRAFLTGDVRFDPTWSARLTLNPYPQAIAGGVSEPHGVLLQQAYLQAQDLYPGSTVQLGMVTLPWFAYESELWGYQMLGRLPMAGGLAGSAPAMESWDQGLQVFGDHGALSYAAGVYNGEGFRGTETDGKKSYQARVTLRAPFGLELTALGQQGGTAASTVRDRASVLLGFRSETFRCALQGTRLWDQAQGTAPLANGQVLSAFETVRLPIPGAAPIELLLRGDYIEPNEALSGDERLEAVAGLAFHPTPGVTLVLDDQNITEFRATGRASSNVVALHTRFAF